MKSNDHLRAADLIGRSGEAPHPKADREWLAAHLSSCDDCRTYEMLSRASAQALAVRPMLDTSVLVARTQAAVQARAAELADRRARNVLLVIACSMMVAFSALSLWALWELKDWAQVRYGLGAMSADVGLALLWFLPASVGGVLLLFFGKPLGLAVPAEFES